MRSLAVILSMVLSSIAQAGTVTKVPAPAAAGDAAVYDSRTYRIMGAEQEDFDGDDWICMHTTSLVETTSPWIGTATSTGFLTAYDCTISATLKDWDADTQGTWIWNDNFKPAGVKWTATKLECMLTFPLPTTTPVDSEDFTFAVGWRDADNETVDVTNTVVLDSNDAGGVSVTATPNLEIGTTAAVAGMVVMVNSDDAAGGSHLDNINAVCMVTLKVE